MILKHRILEDIVFCPEIFYEKSQKCARTIVIRMIRKRGSYISFYSPVFMNGVYFQYDARTHLRDRTCPPTYFNRAFAVQGTAELVTQETMRQPRHRRSGKAEQHTPTNLYILLSTASRSVGCLLLRSP